jgi:hypothetical protein
MKVGIMTTILAVEFEAAICIRISPAMKARR